MSQIKNASAKIDNLKISIPKGVVIYTLNNFNSYFQPYLAILSHNTGENEKLSTLCKLIKVLEDEQLYLSHENKGTANYTCSSKPKKTKLSEQKEKGDIEKRSNNEGDKKK